MIPSHLPRIKAYPGCHKCYGTGYQTTKHGEYKICKKCRKLYLSNRLKCERCGNTGYKIKNGKPCHCIPGMFHRMV